MALGPIDYADIYSQKQQTYPFCYTVTVSSLASLCSNMNNFLCFIHFFLFILTFLISSYTLKTSEQNNQTSS